MLSWYRAQLGPSTASQTPRYTGCGRISWTKIGDFAATPVTWRVCAPKNQAIASFTNFVSCSGCAPATSGSSSALNRASRSGSSRSSTITAPSASSAAAMRSGGIGRGDPVQVGHARQCGGSQRIAPADGAA